MYCKNCGTKNQDDVFYCSNCGAKLTPVDSVRQEPRVSGRLSDTKRQAGTRRRKTGRKRPVVFLASCAGIGIAVGVLMVLFVHFRGGIGGETGTDSMTAKVEQDAGAEREDAGTEQEEKTTQENSGEKSTEQQTKAASEGATLTSERIIPDEDMYVCVNEKVQGDITETYDYDLHGRTISTTSYYHGEKTVTEYEYDDQGNVVARRSSDDSVVIMDYDSEGRLKNYKLFLHESDVESDDFYVSNQDIEYDEYGNRVYYVYENFHGSHTETCEYEYDENGNIIEKDERSSLGSSTYTCYEYDENNRMISETVDGNTTSFEYDEKGNLVKEESASKLCSYSYDENNNLIREEKYTKTEDGENLMLEETTTWEYQLLSDYLNSPNSDEEKPRIDNMPNGSLIKFGSYEQDGNIDNGKEPIWWFIFQKNDEKALLMSAYILDAVPYFAADRRFAPDKEIVNDRGLELRVDGSTELVVTWDKSDLRTWLNNDFYNTAFSEEEKEAIVTTVISTPSTGDYMNGCPDTEDQVFVLSGRELNMDGTENQRMKTSWCTDYALERVRDTYFNTYWLRSNMSQEVVDDAKDIMVYDSYHKGTKEASSSDLCDLDDNVGVRPAVWVTMSSMQNCEVKEGYK